MNVIDKLATMQMRNDEGPNKELALELCSRKDHEGISEIVDHLGDSDQNVASDCIKVLYEAGRIDPEMISEYAVVFLKLLGSRDNRMVWGAMAALASIARDNADLIFLRLTHITEAMETGSVITVDNAVKVLAGVASKSDEYTAVIFPKLLKHLRLCRPKEIPQHAESTIPAVTSANKALFISVLKEREHLLSKPQLARTRRLISRLESAE
ncbi:MAG: hypothetical protein K0M69_13365 [Youngiibacter sp.]|nr:hypothetical protein [Youngiibacter sp.]